MESIDELKTIRFKAFEIENRGSDAPYHPQLARYQAALASSKDHTDAKSKLELAEAFLELRKAFVAWKEEP